LLGWPPHLSEQLELLSDLTPEQLELVNAALASLEYLRLVPSPKHPAQLLPVRVAQRLDHLDFLLALEDDGAPIGLQLLLQNMPPELGVVKAQIGLATWPELSRQPASQEVLGLS